MSFINSLVTDEAIKAIQQLGAVQKENKKLKEENEALRQYIKEIIKKGATK